MTINRRQFIQGLAASIASSSHAATVYRSLDADGKVIYSDKAPASGKVQKTLDITNGPTSPLPPAVLKYQAELEKSMNQRLKAAAAPAGITLLFTTKTCGYCNLAKAYLGEKRIAYQEHDIETADGMRTFASVGGGRGVPVLVNQDKRVAGFSKPSYDAFFAALK